MARHSDEGDDSLHIEDLTSTYDDDEQPAKRKSFFVRHKVLTSFLVLVGLLLGAVGGFAFYLNSKLSNITTYVSSLEDGDRIASPPAPADGQKAPVNILLLGADASSGPSISEQLEAGTWKSGSMRSDAVMLVHIPADRAHVYIMSFPRDSWIEIPGHGTNKINAAFSLGGPDLALQTVEQYSQVYIDHVMMIDWEGFRDLTDAVGGVEITEPGVGTVVMDGDQALDYVRTRKSLPNGDFDRVKRQQNFIRALMAQTVDSITVTDPLMLVDVLSAVTDNTTVDSELTPGKIRDLAWEMRSFKTSNVTFMTVPTLGTGMEGAASVVYLDDEECAELFAAMRDGLLPQHFANNPADTLPHPTSVN